MSDEKLYEIEFFEQKFLEELYFILKNDFLDNALNNIDQVHKIVENQHKISLISFLNDFIINKNHFGNGMGFNEKKFILDIPIEEINPNCNQKNKICDKELWGLFVYLHFEEINKKDYENNFINFINLEKTQNNYKSLIVDDNGVIQGFYSPLLDIIGPKQSKTVYYNDECIMINNNSSITIIDDSGVEEIPYKNDLLIGKKKEISFIKLYLSYVVKILLDENDEKIESIIICSIPNGKLVQYYENGMEFSINNRKVGALAPGLDNKNAKFRIKKFNKFDLLDNDSLRIKVLYFDENMSNINEFDVIKEIYESQ